MSPRPDVEYTDVAEVRGPLLVVRGACRVGWDESARIRMHSGEVRTGLVLEVDRDLAVVQMLEGTGGIDLDDTRVRFAGETFHVPVGPGWLGRVCNGRGEPVDGGPPVLGRYRARSVGRRSTRRVESLRPSPC